MPSLATFNANNFFLRYRFTNNYPGGQSQASLVEAGEIGLVGYVPGLAFGAYTNRWIVWDVTRRELAARALREPDNQLPDILCFQEVENIHAIRILSDRYLGGFYPYSLLIDSYDPRNIDVGILSRFPLRQIRTHIDDLNDAGQRIFSRDCAEVQVELPDGAVLTLFVNHLKSKFVRRQAGDTEAEFHARIRRSHERRLAQAQAVARYIGQRFEGRQTTALYAVVGDFNDTPESPWVAPLFDTPRLTDVLARHRPAADVWTYYWRSRGRVSQIDHVLASRALRDRVDDAVAADPDRVPHIERQGLAYRELNASNLVLPRQATLVHFEADPVTPAPANATPDQRVGFRFARYQEVMDNWRSNISDHCPVKVWF
jgi:endonuclease/exonuclease/phosphatase family metal-dependent hydrolase